MLNFSIREPYMIGSGAHGQLSPQPWDALVLADFNVVIECQPRFRFFLLLD